MANEVGRYVGETIIGRIGSNVRLGQVVYSRSISTSNPDVQKKGVWFPVGCDTLNTIFIQPGDQPKWASSNQLGVVVEAATYSPITSTQSGTETTILLKGYYSPGRMSFPGSSFVDTGYYYTAPGANTGGPLYIMPEVLTMAGEGGATKSTVGAFSNFLPTSTALGYGNAGATQGAARIIGYTYDLNEPYVIRFEPDNTWIEFGN
jgi:hypothetical protein